MSAAIAVAAPAPVAVEPRAPAALSAVPDEHEPVPAPQPGRSVADLSIAELLEIWPAALEAVGADFPVLAAVLRKARPVEFVDEALVVAFPSSESFNRRMVADNTEHKRAVADALVALTGAAFRIDYELRDLASDEAQAALSGDELVARLVQEFDAQEIVPEPDQEGS